MLLEIGETALDQRRTTHVLHRPLVPGLAVSDVAAHGGVAGLRILKEGKTFFRAFNGMDVTSVCTVESCNWRCWSGWPRTTSPST